MSSCLLEQLLVAGDFPRSGRTNQEHLLFDEGDGNVLCCGSIALLLWYTLQQFSALRNKQASDISTPAYSFARCQLPIPRMQLLFLHLKDGVALVYVENCTHVGHKTPRCICSVSASGRPGAGVILIHQDGPYYLTLSTASWDGLAFISINPPCYRGALPDLRLTTLLHYPGSASLCQHEGTQSSP